jgi:hypothetical protein
MLVFDSVEEVDHIRFIPRDKLNTMSDNDRRRIHYTFLIDANCINSRGRLQHMNTLEKWHKDKVIKIMMPQPAQDEAAYGSGDRARKAYGYIMTMTESGPEDKRLLDVIENILFPNNATTQNEKNDIEVVFNARKYACILVTNDGGSRRQPGGILGNRDKLLKELGVDILTDEEAVRLIRERIRERDDRERERCSIAGQPVPEWVGKD